MEASSWVYIFWDVVVLRNHAAMGSVLHYLQRLSRYVMGVPSKSIKHGAYYDSVLRFLFDFDTV
ncbi:hypothetical protein D3C81_2170400 [compost metagenome]